MRKTLLTTVAAMAALCGTATLAAISTDELVTRYQADGYTFIEVTNGRTQVKVEAVKGGDKVEVIYDAETGQILKSEAEPAGDDAGRTGVRVRDRDRDFVRDRDGRDDDDEDDDRDDDNSGRGGGDDDGDDSSGRGGDDDDGDDSSGHGGGDDDDGGDDKGGDRGGSDDD